MFLKRLFLRIKNNLKTTLTEFCDGMSKPLAIVNIAVVCFFSLLIFSIPAISFITGLHYITWGLTITVLVLMAASFGLGNKLKIDIISLLFVAFIISAFISCALSRFETINITYFFLTIFIIVTYTYSKSNSKIRKGLLFAIYIGTLLFLIIYLGFYGKKILSFGQERLGQNFGDINDISIFNGLGLSFALYYAFFSKRIQFIVLNGIVAALFVLAILSSGSKISYLFIPIVLIACVFFKLGIKRWWISFLITLGLIGAFILLIQLPILSPIRIKILSMFNVFVKVDTTDALNKDYSTSNRYSMFMIGMEMFLRKPLFGYGVNGFQYYGGYSNGTGWSHNHFSEVLSATGLIGFALYDFPIFYSLYQGIKNKKRLPSIVIIYYIVTMISIALPGEKLFAYPIGVIIASAYSPSDVRVFSFDVFKRRKENVLNDQNC